MPAPFSRLLYLALTPLLCLITSLPALADSTVRIVRLSFVDGKVDIDRGTGGYEKAIVNLPVAQGARLRTGTDGRVEVEFENGSTLRLAPQSEAAFPRLSLRESGTKDSEIEVSKGTVYLHYVGNKDNQFTIDFGSEKILLSHAASVRLGVGAREASVAVFKGDVTVDGPSGSVEVRKKQTAKFELSDQAGSEVAKNIHPEPYDSWNNEQEQYHERYATTSYAGYSPYAYGTSDLAYYGGFYSLPGYGMLWQPYFAGLGWDPFMNGAWAFSPGGGFGWVSGYPWGWVPYHYGNWIFVPSYGWMWQPGGSWTTWYSQPRVLNPPAGFSPPRPPSSGTATVFVNRGPRSEMASEGRLILRTNSAGLGVPRGELGSLRSLSQKAEKHGFVARSIEPVSAGPNPFGHSGMSPGLHSVGSVGRESVSSAHSGSPSAGAPASHH